MGTAAGLAEDDLVVALGYAVLRGGEPLVQRGGGGALDDDGAARTRDRAQQLVVLHPRGADHDTVRVLGDGGQVQGGERLDEQGSEVSVEQAYELGPGVDAAVPPAQARQGDVGRSAGPGDDHGGVLAHEVHRILPPGGLRRRAAHTWWRTRKAEPVGLCLCRLGNGRRQVTATGSPGAGGVKPK